MRTRALILVIALTTAFAPATFGDKLHLRDGTILKGNAVRNGDTWSIVTVSGESLTFPVGKVKRHVFESRVTPAEAARMMTELNALAMTALSVPEPNQFTWLGSVREYSNSFNYDSGSLTATWGRRSSVDMGSFEYDSSRSGSQSEYSTDGSSDGRQETKAVRGQSLDGVFVDQWARYIAHYESLARDLRYRELTKPRKYSGSLAEFAMWPPESHAQQAKAIKTALKAVKECIQLADKTQRLVDHIPDKKRRLEADIARAERAAAKARDRLNLASDENTRQSRKRKLVDAQDDLRSRVVELKSRIPKATRNAERTINNFARQREVTRGAVSRAMSGNGGGFRGVRPGRNWYFETGNSLSGRGNTAGTG